MKINTTEVGRALTMHIAYESYLHEIRDAVFQEEEVNRFTDKCLVCGKPLASMTRLIGACVPCIEERLDLDRDRYAMFLRFHLENGVIR